MPSATYVTYYEVHSREDWDATPGEDKVGLPMVEVGRPDEEDSIVFHVLEDMHTATENIYNCPRCYDDADILIGDYPSLGLTTSVVTDGVADEAPRLTPHEYC